MKWCSQIKCIFQEVIALEINYLGGYFLSTFFLAELLFYKVIGWGFLNILNEWKIFSKFTGLLKNSLACFKHRFLEIQSFWQIWINGMKLKVFSSQELWITFSNMMRALHVAGHTQCRFSYSETQKHVFHLMILMYA